MWFNENFYKYTVAVLLVLLIILVLYYTAPFFSPILWFATAILVPVLFSTLLYYILRPVVYFFARWMPRYCSILITYLLTSLAIAIAAFFLIPSMKETLEHLSPEKIESMKEYVTKLIEGMKKYPNIPERSLIEQFLINYMPKINAVIYTLSLNLLSNLTNITIGLALTPFVLFYFLKDDTLFSPFILRYIPAKFQEEVQKILHEIDSALEEFIQSQMIVACVIGSCIFSGFLIIGLPNALALALFAMIFYIIPFLGTFIALIPALIVAFTINFTMVLKVIAVVGLAHLIETNLVTPRVMSQKLNIHPLTIIFLLLAAGSLYGLVGLLLVTPTYAIIKVVVWNLYKISRLRYAAAKMAMREEKENAPPE